MERERELGRGGGEQGRRRKPYPRARASIVRTPRGRDDFVLRDCKEKGRTRPIPRISGINESFHEATNSLRGRGVIDAVKFKKFRKTLTPRRICLFNVQKSV